METTLFTDWMFLAGVAGVIVSGAALPFFFQRYLHAPAAGGPVVLPPSDTPEEFPDEPVRVLDEEDNKEDDVIKKEEPVDAAIKEVPPEPAAKESPKADVEPPKKFNTGATMVGGISPAIVYLQNLKLQIEHFEKEIHELRAQVSGFAQAHDQQFHALLDRMGQFQKELHHELEAGPSKAPASQEPAAKPAAKPAAAPPAAKPVAAPPAAKPAAAPPAAKPVAAPPAVKPAPKPEPKAQAAAEPKIELKIEEPRLDPKPAPKAEKKEEGPGLDVELSVSSAEPKSGIELSLAADAKPSSADSAADSAAKEVADTLKVEDAKLSIPVKKPPKDQGDDDILKPSGKGPVWPV